jgi:hypothetical protein
MGHKVANLFEKALAVQMKAYGKYHPQTFTSL